jgi:hypothetical protein
MKSDVPRYFRSDAYRPASLKHGGLPRNDALFIIAELANRSVPPDIEWRSPEGRAYNAEFVEHLRLALAQYERETR